jgi:hypothetical protein
MIGPATEKVVVSADDMSLPAAAQLAKARESVRALCRLASRFETYLGESGFESERLDSLADEVRGPFLDKTIALAQELEELSRHIYRAALHEVLVES